MAGNSAMRQGRDFCVRDGRLFGPFMSRGIPLLKVRDAIEWIAWSADGEYSFRSGDMKKELGIPQSHVSTILGALSSIGAVVLASRRMGYAVTDDDPDGWVCALTTALASSQSAAESHGSEPCEEPEPVCDAWDESGISCYEPRVADLAAAMRLDSRGRDVAFRCWIGEVRAYLFLRPEGDGVHLLGMAKQRTPAHAGGPAWFEGSYDGIGIGFDDEGKLRRFSSAREHGLVIRGPLAPVPGSAPQPRSGSIRIMIPLSAPDREIQRIIDIARPLPGDEIVMY